MDVYSIGEMVIDFTPGLEEASYIRNAGGAPANLAISAAKNGLEAGMLCSVGNDDFGRFLLDTLRENGVEVLRPSLCDKAVTTMAFVSLSPDGDRSFVFARKPGADMFLTEEDVRSEDIARSIIVHAGSCSLSAGTAAGATRKALRLGHESGCLVSFDLNYRDLLWDGDAQACVQAVREILPFVDIMKVSDEEIGLLGGEEAVADLMKTNGLTAVVETLGANGARCFFNGTILEVPSLPSRCVDATAAGDAFWGAFLSSLVRSGVRTAADLTAEKLKKAMEHGNASGALCVQTKGAIAALPTYEEILVHLGRKEYGKHLD